MYCIIHYKGNHTSKYTPLKALSATNIERIHEAKIEREKYLDKNHHEQCTTIPEQINPEKPSTMLCIIYQHSFKKDY